MKISKIAKLCKDTKCVQYAVEEKGMWLGNGDCAYLIPEFAYLSQEGIALALGIGEKDKSKYRFQHMDLHTFNLEDFDEAETPCDQIEFIMRSKEIPYRTEEGVRFLDLNMLDVLKDEIESLKIYMRRTKDGRAYFVGKIGMYIFAFFAPQRIINADFINKLNEFNNLCRVTYQNDEANAVRGRERMTEYRKAKGQTALESVEQECLMRWVQFVAGKYPELELLYHIPNGGTRNKREAEHLRRQGVKNTHPHRFRRTAATLALNRGMPIEQVSQMLGHEKIETTTIYARSDKDNVKASHRKYVV